MRKHIGFLFVLLTYILTWSVEIPVALTKHGYTAINVSKGLQTICTLSPGIVALILTAIFFKKNALKTLLKAVVKWRVRFKWYFIIIILGIGLCGLSLLLFDWTYGQINNPDPAYNFIFYFILILPLSAFWEEIGWRGFLLPILQEKYSPLKASIIIGFVWGLWHLPIYLAINPYRDQTFSYFLFMFIGCFAISIIETWLYNSTKGSLFVCILFHNAINTSAAYFYGNLKGTEFRPLIIWIILLVLTAISVNTGKTDPSSPRQTDPLVKTL
ncbi:MAG: CPBP family intramembrane metalloprotease [Bacteroidota bacterium]|nr:CPBP family intramembrane metalloprotease [Bacteroidota bacterium]